VSRADSILVIGAGDARQVRTVPESDFVIAADGGLAMAEALGLDVDVVVGDMDSVDPHALAEVGRRGARIVRHQREKDQTDLELALDVAVAEEPARIHVLVGAGGRLDHAVANLAVLASPRWADSSVSADVGGAGVWVVRGLRLLPLTVGDPVALHPVGGPAIGVTTVGLAYSLDNDTLDAFAGRGISNEVVSVPVGVTVESGVLLAINAPRQPNGPVGARDRARARSSWTGGHR
jgi:thiamine pyrophosphokinase